MTPMRLLFVVSILLFCTPLLNAKDLNPKRTIVFTTVNDSDIDSERFKAVSPMSVLFTGNYLVGYDKNNRVCKIKSIKHDGGKYTINLTADIVRFHDLFAGVQNLETVILPEGVEEIMHGAFDNCVKLKSISFPPSLKIIGSAFSGCEELVIDEIPPSVEEIREGALWGNTINIAHLSNATRICDRAFYRAKIGRIELPSSVPHYAFEEASIRSLTVNEFNAEICNVLAEIDTLIVKQGTQSIFLERGNNAVIHHLYLPSSIKADGRNSLSGVRVENVHLSEGLVSIPRGLFKGFDISQIVLPKSLRVIEDEAFEDCVNIEEVILPNGLKEIGRNAFLRCRALKSIMIPDGVETIGSHAFAGCDSLKTVKLPTSITQINNSCFSGCKALEEIDIPTGVTLIDGGAFCWCQSLNKAHLPKTVEEIGFCAFEGCSELCEINLPEGLSVIKGDAFNGCRSLREVVFPTTVTSVERGAFWGCSNIVPLGLSENFISSNTFPKRVVPDHLKDPIYVGSYSSGVGYLCHRIVIGTSRFTYISPSGARMEVGYVKNGVLYSVAGDEWGAVDTKDGKYVVFQGITLYRD